MLLDLVIAAVVVWSTPGAAFATLPAAEGFGVFDEVVLGFGFKPVPVTQYGATSGAAIRDDETCLLLVSLSPLGRGTNRPTILG
jgi:hypothetical protein